MWRFIPAGAGNTQRHWQQGQRLPVYPRWRGEHTVSQPISSISIGLSPLARGTRKIKRSCRHGSRFIPAGAGNTGALPLSRWIPTVYPRWRGEHPSDASRQTTCRGLSPLARGTLCWSWLSPHPARFIPAGAGNTRRRRSQRTRGAVYPRWRGEHQQGVLTERDIGGLSPLARGTPCSWLRKGCRTRFIPAGAGNTSPRQILNPHTPVYPRWRGEHSSSNAAARRPDGLSPLARGTPLMISAVADLARFIPAGAGNTAGRSFSASYPAVYPRWRGEHFCLSVISSSSFGLSPLARGTL